MSFAQDRSWSPSQSSRLTSYPHASHLQIGSEWRGGRGAPARNGNARSGNIVSAGRNAATHRGHVGGGFVRVRWYRRINSPSASQSPTDGVLRPQPSPQSEQLSVLPVPATSSRLAVAAPTTAPALSATVALRVPELDPWRASLQNDYPTATASRLPSGSPRAIPPTLAIFREMGNILRAVSRVGCAEVGLAPRHRWPS
jgi:hypothetical protein